MQSGTFYSKESEEVFLRADKIFSRRAPKALWLALLETSLGSEILGYLQLDYSTVRELANPLNEGIEEIDEILTMAKRTTILTEPGLDCIEQAVYSCLLNRETDFSRMLDSLGIDRRRATDLIVERLRQDGSPSYFDHSLVHPYTEGEILKACLQSRSLAREVLEEVGVDIDLVLWLASEWKKTNFHGRYLAVGVAKPGHLALGLRWSHTVQKLMGQAGVTPTRLRLAVERAFADYPREALRHGLAPETAGKEEAARLGYSEVTPDLLLLGLLSDPYSAAATALKRAGYSIDQLRAELNPQSKQSSVDDAELSGLCKDLLARAVISGGEIPDGLFLLAELIPHCPVLSLKEKHLRIAVKEVQQGSFPRSGSVSVDGLSLYIGARELEEKLGKVTKTVNEHGFEIWSCNGTSANIENGIVVGLMGRILKIDGQVILQKGDSGETVRDLFGVSGTVELQKPRLSSLSALVGDGGLQFVIWGDLEWMERTAS